MLALMTSLSGCVSIEGPCSEGMFHRTTEANPLVAINLDSYPEQHALPIRTERYSQEYARLYLPTEAFEYIY
jgi:hypothetical protein